jgi:C-terminal processing protease CtpA/Prc
MQFQPLKSNAMHLGRFRITLLLLLLLGIASPLSAQSIPGTLSAEQAVQDARILKRTLQALHPALTKYRTQAEMDAAFARFEQRAGKAGSAADLYLAATELAASIRCGHTWTNVLNQEGAAKAALLDRADKLPFTLKLAANRWRVLASADPQISASDEIVSINGDDATAMVNKMMPYLRADGSSDGKRLQQLNHDRGDYSQMDIVWPLLSPPQNGLYRLDVRKSNGKRVQVAVNATTLAMRDAKLAAQGIRPASEEWTLRIDGDTAVMTLPTFSFWNSDFNWSDFIDKAFAELQSKRVAYLIIDIRANEGGDGAIGGKLLSHLVKQPFTFISDQSTTTYERVPYNLARYLDTWDFGFFDRTGQVEKITEGTAAGKYRFLPNAAKKQTIEPVAKPYAGKAFLLISAENSSATFQLAMLAKRSSAATLVGQRTGGNQRGLNGGQLAWVVLPNSGVSVDIPLLASTYTEDTPDYSIDPDITVQPRFAAAASGVDMEMEKALALIRKTRAGK